MMNNFIKKTVIACIGITWLCHGQQHGDYWQFSDEFLQLHIDDTSQDYGSAQPTYEYGKQESPRICPTQNEQPDPTCPLLFGANAYQLINYITAGYILANIYESYQTLHATRPRSSIMNMVQTPSKYISFFVSCLETTCKALLYKSVAQLIVMCVDGDIFDFVGCGLRKVAHIVV